LISQMQRQKMGHISVSPPQQDVGRPYMGQICVREIVEAEIEEASLLAKPANKIARGIF